MEYFQKGANVTICVETVPKQFGLPDILDWGETVPVGQPQRKLQYSNLGDT